MLALGFGFFVLAVGYTYAANGFRFRRVLFTRTGIHPRIKCGSGFRSKTL